MADKERKVLVERLRTFGAWADVQPRHALTRDAADQIEADGQRIAEVEALLDEVCGYLDEDYDPDASLRAKYRALSRIIALLGDK